MTLPNFFLSVFSFEVVNGYACDVRVMISVSGSFCFFSSSMCIYALVELAVFFSVASLIVDSFFSFCMKKFRYAKSSNDIDELISRRQAQKADHRRHHRSVDEWVHKLESAPSIANIGPETSSKDLARSSTFYLSCDAIEDLRPEQLETSDQNDLLAEDLKLPGGGELSMAYAADSEQTIEVELSGLTSPAGKKYNGRRATVSSAKMKNKQNDRWTVRVGDEYVQVRKENLK